MHSDESKKVKKNILLRISLNFLSLSEESYAVLCEATVGDFTN